MYRGCVSGADMYLIYTECSLTRMTVDVTTTFETPAELAQIDESNGSRFGVATAPIGNETNAGEGNGTAVEASGTALIKETHR